MGIISWIILGGIAGWIASKIMGTDASMGLMANIIVGIVGALIGGFLFSLIGASDITGFNLWSLFVAVIGSVVLLGLVKAMGGRSAA
jgi:uncharacterized membrane protein YeaQ/YmgE (transglycosylase-associated protein family)